MDIGKLNLKNDFLLYLPYWLIILVIAPLWWAAVLWIACRHEKPVELASGQGGRPFTPEPGET